jgi:cytochrome c551/c552
MHKGSQGKWGQIPMPPTANLKDEDAKALAGWIMSL